MQPAITSCTFRAGPQKADGLFAYQKVDWCDFLDFFCDFFSYESCQKSEVCTERRLVCF